MSGTQMNPYLYPGCCNPVQRPRCTVDKDECSVSNSSLPRFGVIAQNGAIAASGSLSGWVGSPGQTVTDTTIPRTIAAKTVMIGNTAVITYVNISGQPVRLIVSGGATLTTTCNKCLSITLIFRSVDASDDAMMIYGSMSSTIVPSTSTPLSATTLAASAFELAAGSSFAIYYNIVGCDKLCSCDGSDESIKVCINAEIKLTLIALPQ